MGRQAGHSKRLAVTLTLMVVTALVVAWLAYRPGFSGGFYFDDLQNIVEAFPLHWKALSWTEIRQTWASANLPTRFLPNASFGMNHLYGGLNPVGYHWVNWLLHLGVGAALAWVCLGFVRTGTRKEPTQFLGHAIIAVSALFVLHPLFVQSVTYIVQRMNLMAALFALLSFGCYLGARNRGPGTTTLFLYGAGVVLWFMAALSKENAFSLPLVVLAHELCFYPATWKRLASTLVKTFRGRIASIVILVMVTLAALFTWDYLQLSKSLHLTETWAKRDYNGLERVLTQSRVQILYLSLLFWPTLGRLSLEHDFSVSRSLTEPWTTLPAILFWAVLAGVAVFYARKHPRFSFPVLAYLLLHGIESGPLNLELVFEHRMYLPVAFLMLLPAAGIAALPVHRRRPAIAVLVALWIPAATITWNRNITWGDRVAFHQDVAMKSPNLYRPQYNLGTLLGKIGRLEEAQVALNRAVSLNAGSSEAHNQLGNVSFLQNDLRGAQAHYKEAVRLEPRNSEAVYNVAMSLDRAGRFTEAAEWYRRFLGAVPPHLEWKIPEVRRRLKTLGGMPETGMNRVQQPRQG